MAKSGIDVSQWQGTINWSQVKGKVDFALIRAGYGDTLSYPKQVDWQYAANYAGCKANGIPVGGISIPTQLQQHRQSVRLIAA